MTLKCVQGEPESEAPIFVCHHCGKPVCEKHGLVVSADDAFDGSDPLVSRAAMHCGECARYHPSAHPGWEDPKAVQHSRDGATARP
jgi:hypothetical protein